jgi:hypothetical protein
VGTAVGAYGFNSRQIALSLRLALEGDRELAGRLRQDLDRMVGHIRAPEDEMESVRADRLMAMFLKCPKAGRRIVKG